MVAGGAAFIVVPVALFPVLDDVDEFDSGRADCDAVVGSEGLFSGSAPEFVVELVVAPGVVVVAPAVGAQGTAPVGG